MLMGTPHPSTEFRQGVEEYFLGGGGERVKELLKGSRLNWMTWFLTGGKEQGITDTESSLKRTQTLGKCVIDGEKTR